MIFENVGAPDGRIDFVEHQIQQSEGAAAGFHAKFADLNDDSRLDIVVTTLGGLGWLEQPSSLDRVWTMHRTGTFRPDSMTGRAVGDVDGDSDPDVLAGSYSRGPRDGDGDQLTAEDALGRLGWFENPGQPTGSWTRHDISRRKRGMFDELLARVSMATETWSSWAFVGTATPTTASSGSSKCRPKPRHRRLPLRVNKIVWRCPCRRQTASVLSTRIAGH